MDLGHTLYLSSPSHNFNLMNLEPNQGLHGVWTTSDNTTIWAAFVLKKMWGHPLILCDYVVYLLQEMQGKMKFITSLLAPNPLTKMNQLYQQSLVSQWTNSNTLSSRFGGYMYLSFYMVNILKSGESRPHQSTYILGHNWILNTLESGCVGCIQEYPKPTYFLTCHGLRTIT